MGFADAEDDISLNKCDFLEHDDTNRLCWHMNNGNEIVGGWRCGDTVWLNRNQDWERSVWTKNIGNYYENVVVVPEEALEEIVPQEEMIIPQEEVVIPQEEIIPQEEAIVPQEEVIVVEEEPVINNRPFGGRNPRQLTSITYTPPTCGDCTSNNVGEWYVDRIISKKTLTCVLTSIV